MANVLAKNRPLSPARGQWEPFTMLRGEFDNLLSKLFADEEVGWTSGTMPATLDFSETDSAFEVRMDIPGVQAKDIDIQFNGNMLIVKAERKEEKEEKGKTFHRIERHCGCFQRSVMLPSTINEGQIDAEYTNGVLTVKLPKTTERKPNRIPVKG
jgi:HSP20 family protein